VARRLILSAERMDELESHLMLFYSGIKRTASEVAESFVPGIAEKRAQLGRFRAMVDEGAAILSAGRPLREFGMLLDEAWRLKRGLSALVSNADVDEMYAAALGAGAWGGKLLGAGGGGFVLIFTPPERRAAVRDALRGHIHVPFRMESSGSQIIFYDPEQEYHEAEAERASGAHRAFREMGAN
jgi:D-glycero-alpha-D-manno-heptose-7-phosphate kinase